MTRTLQCVAAILALGSLVLAPGCQFAAGIANESDSCPTPKGVTTLQCNDTCKAYCTNVTCNVAQYYPDEGSCCAVCMASSVDTNNCRQVALAASACQKLAPYLSASGAKACSDQLGAFESVLTAVCPKVKSPGSFDSSKGPDALLVAAQARYVGCDESADCLCEQVAKNATVLTAVAACQADYDACANACKLLRK